MPKQIAPRLASGKKRESYGGRLPGRIRAGLKLIAEHENKSVSWVMEEVIIRYFKMKTPKYIVRKQKVK